MIGNITAVPEIGKVYLGKVVRLAEFGAFVELFPGTDGLLHISEIAEHRVKEVKDELREGDQVMVKVLAIEGNRIKLSRKALIKEQKAKLAQPAPAEAESMMRKPLERSSVRPRRRRPGRAMNSTSASPNQTRAPSSSKAETTSMKMPARSSTKRTSPTSTVLRLSRWWCGSACWIRPSAGRQQQSPAAPAASRRRWRWPRSWRKPGITAAHDAIKQRPGRSIRAFSVFLKPQTGSPFTVSGSFTAPLGQTPEHRFALGVKRDPRNGSGNAHSVAVSLRMCFESYILRSAAMQRDSMSGRILG